MMDDEEKTTERPRNGVEPVCEAASFTLLGFSKFCKESIPERNLIKVYTCKDEQNILNSKEQGPAARCQSLEWAWRGNPNISRVATEIPGWQKKKARLGPTLLIRETDSKFFVLLGISVDCRSMKETGSFVFYWRCLFLNWTLRLLICRPLLDPLILKRDIFEFVGFHKHCYTRWCYSWTSFFDCQWYGSKCPLSIHFRQGNLGSMRCWRSAFKKRK